MDLTKLSDLLLIMKVLKQVINIGPDEELITINKLAENIANILKFNVNPTYLDDRPQEVKLATCSSKKARELLGYRTNTNLKDGLIKTIEYIKKNEPRKFQYHLDLEIINKLTPKTWKNKIF